MHLREALLQSRDEIKEVLEWQIRVQPADDVELSHRFAITRRCGFESLFERHGVRARSIFFTAECTQPARRDTYVRWIDMAIYVEVGDRSMQPFPDQVRHVTQRQDILAPVQRESIFVAKSNIRFDFFQNRKSK